MKFHLLWLTVYENDIRVSGAILCLWLSKSLDINKCRLFQTKTDIDQRAINHNTVPTYH